MKIPVYPLLLASLLSANTSFAEVLVSIGTEDITDKHLEHALNSSPFSTQFNTMEAIAQASLRGDMLRRLVVSRLLRLEAEKLALDKSPVFQAELSKYKRGLLYRRYMDSLRASLSIDSDKLSAIESFHQGDDDALTATESVYSAEQYKQARLNKLKELQQLFHSKIWTERINADAKADTVLFEADDGLVIHYQDIVASNTDTSAPSKAWIEARLYPQAELLLISHAAEKLEKFDLSSELNAFAEDRLSALLMEQKSAEWTQDAATLRAYFDQHPEIAIVPERIHVGQIVVSSEAEAQSLRQRILAGENLFELAEQYSIDPQGKQNKGDMGWVKVGTGMPEIEQAISHLADNQVSDVIKTPKGFHLVSIIERRTGETRKYDGVIDRVKEQVITEKMTAYIKDLEKQYHTVWHVLNEN